jgi:hypothetical protein
MTGFTYYMRITWERSADDNSSSTSDSVRSLTRKVEGVGYRFDDKHMGGINWCGTGDTIVNEWWGRGLKIRQNKG